MPDAFRVPNALPGRGSVNVEIFGMAGVPEGAAPGITVSIGTNIYAVLHMLPLSSRCLTLSNNTQQKYIEL